MDLSKRGFSGVISITNANSVILQQAYGYADIPNEIKNTIDTKFATASAGKVFVAVGILQLIEQGKISLDTKIGKILSINYETIDENIKISQLLNHTSGIPDYFDESIMDEYDELWKDFPNYKIRKSADLLPLFEKKPMMYPVGEKFQYNNSGFVVLGLIIEELTGMDFDLFLDKSIFKPCKMDSTGYFELDRLPKKCANSYIYDTKRKEYYTNIYSVDAKGTGAGGAFTTVEDINKFWKNLLEGKLISLKMLENMLKIQSSLNDDFYGYGLWIDKKEDVLNPFFQGCDPGVSFISYYDTVKKKVFTIISNKGDDVWELKDEALKQF